VLAHVTLGHPPVSGEDKKVRSNGEVTICTGSGIDNETDRLAITSTPIVNDGGGGALLICLLPKDVEGEVAPMPRKLGYKSHPYETLKQSGFGAFQLYGADGVSAACPDAAAAVEEIREAHREAGTSARQRARRCCRVVSPAPSGSPLSPALPHPFPPPTCCPSGALIVQPAIKKAAAAKKAAKTHGEGYRKHGAALPNAHYGAKGARPPLPPSLPRPSRPITLLRSRLAGELSSFANRVKKGRAKGGAKGAAKAEAAVAKTSAAHTLAKLANRNGAPPASPHAAALPESPPPPPTHRAPATPRPSSSARLTLPQVRPTTRWPSGTRC